MTDPRTEILARCQHPQLSWGGRDKRLEREAIKRTEQFEARLNAAGYVIVPREPTAEMLKAGNENIEAQANDPEWPTNPPCASAVYKAMTEKGASE